MTTFFSLILFTLSAIASSPLEGDYRGKLKINGLPQRTGVLYIREILKDAKNSALVAVLAAENPGGGVGEILPYHFDQFISLSPTSGEFSLKRMPTSSGVGIEILVLDVTLPDANHLQGMMTGNMISGDGELIEANFEFQRTGPATPKS
jgi:hypothetical protein